MKPNATFFAIFLLLCLIPGLIFVFLPRTDIPATGGDIPLGATKAGTNKPLEAQSQNYQVQVEVKKPPLTTGKQVLFLKLTSANLQSPMSDNQASGLPSVQVLMPMGEEMMEADAQ
ncbi:MAG: hypothetical protein K2X66_17220, partial [Cyanobacteria bacterium]|nr:hypothetical protein [Cyanobacteriota bacterium]